MKHILENLRVRQVKRRLKLYESWKKSPLMTGVWFILSRSILHSLTLLLVMSLFGYYWHGEIRWNDLLPIFMMFSFAGFISMLATWGIDSNAFQKRFKEESDVNLSVRELEKI